MRQSIQSGAHECLTVNNFIEDKDFLLQSTKTFYYYYHYYCNNNDLIIIRSWDGIVFFGLLLDSGLFKWDK